MFEHQLCSQAGGWVLNGRSWEDEPLGGEAPKIEERVQVRPIEGQGQELGILPLCPVSMHLSSFSSWDSP